ncbi:MAG: hypothetical protein PHS44_02800 [Candidatus Dojkabacteria bacterium]|jgi:hypothetical protein|nr:hypothetical protein [Candidatus Dojkabacteria bacterium]
MPEEITTPTEPRKKKSPWLWIAGIGCVCLLVLGCICSACAVLSMTSESFATSWKDEMKKQGYCDELEKQNIDPSEDPFGICD